MLTPEPNCRMISVSAEVLIVLRDALREKGKTRILSEEEYDALLHVNTKLSKGR